MSSYTLLESILSLIFSSITLENNEVKEDIINSDEAVITVDNSAFGLAEKQHQNIDPNPRISPSDEEVKTCSNLKESDVELKELCDEFSNISDTLNQIELLIASFDQAPEKCNADNENCDNSNVSSVTKQATIISS